MRQDVVLYLHLVKQQQHVSIQCFNYAHKIRYKNVLLRILHFVHMQDKTSTIEVENQKCIENSCYRN